MLKHFKLIFFLRPYSKVKTSMRGLSAITPSAQSHRLSHQGHRRLLMGVSVVTASSIAATLYCMAKKESDVKGNTKSNTALATSTASDRVRRSLANRDSVSSLHFVAFASMEHNNEPLMTPNDLIDSMIQDQPKPRIRTKMLNESQLLQLLTNTPLIREQREAHNEHRVNSTLLRSLGDRGIITYREYLFILSLLARSKEALRVAFDLIDVNGDGAISRDDFAKFCLKESSHTVGTTLTRHLFGVDGNCRLNFDNFSFFICSLQREILEAEFIEFSRGLELISARDFADLLLRYTNLNAEEKADYEARLERSMQMSIDRLTVSLEDTLTFFELLHCLDAFAYAFGLVAFERAGSKGRRPLTKHEFSRAAQICNNGNKLSPMVVDILFALFDKADDGCLSYDEFFVVLSNRLRRRVPRPVGGWQDFKKCVAAETRSNLASRHVNAF